MTTGCACSTPGRGGITYWPGDRCTDGETKAMPPGAGRTLRQIAHAVLDGMGVPRGHFADSRNAAKEAGS